MGYDDDDDSDTRCCKRVAFRASKRETD
jgi:hypothetical protein